MRGPGRSASAIVVNYGCARVALVDRKVVIGISTTRTRAVPYPGPVRGQLDYGIWTSTTPKRHTYSTSNLSQAFAPLNGSQTTTSENHPAWKSRKKNSFKGDLGGPFYTSKRYVETSSSTTLLSYETYNRFQDLGSFAKYEGPFLPMSPDSYQWPSRVESSSKDLDELGTVAIARCSPASPAANMATFLGELYQEGLPHLIGSGLHALRSMTHRERRRAIGGEYLNYQFGWLPFVSDVRKIAHSIAHAHQVLGQFERGAGKLVRRRYEFPLSKSVTTSTVRQNVSPWLSPSGGGLSGDGSQINKGTVFLTTTVTKKQWFSGGFTYWFPMGSDLRSSLARYAIEARKLLGLSLTPDSIWSVSPWSWAVDWFSDTNEFLTNWSNWAIDGQALAYGYVMEHSIARNTYTFSGPTGYYPSFVRPFDVSLVIETKQRRQATPFGFGLDWNGFSSVQTAIIAALGLSRS
uniref:Uncharacterized protein n=1 Tax=Leviviridae sp. TaxID=2027243 RepID=A0A514CYM3_9VIRU|nr:MAG: hypothetical protein H2Rhizo31384_000005 [Leviviridae sp.]